MSRNRLIPSVLNSSYLIGTRIRRISYYIIVYVVERDLYFVSYILEPSFNLSTMKFIIITNDRPNNHVLYK